MSEFKEEIYEIAFGDDAINKDYSDGEVISRIRKFSDQALLLAEIKDRLITLKEDFEMLQAGKWEPDFDSCQASIDTISELLTKIEEE